MTPGWMLVVGKGVGGCCGGEVVVEKVVIVESGSWCFGAWEAAGDPSYM